MRTYFKNKDEADKFVKNKPLIVCNTCKKSKPSCVFVVKSETTYPSGVPVRYFFRTTCPTCEKYDELTNSAYDNNNSWSVKFNDWVEKTQDLLEDCQFLLMYEKQNSLKSGPKTVEFNTRLEKLLKFLKH